MSDRKHTTISVSPLASTLADVLSEERNQDKSKVVEKVLQQAVMDEIDWETAAHEMRDGDVADLTELVRILNDHLEEAPESVTAGEDDA